MSILNSKRGVLQGCHDFATCSEVVDIEVSLKWMEGEHVLSYRPVLSRYFTISVFFSFGQNLSESYGRHVKLQYCSQNSVPDLHLIPAHSGSWLMVDTAFHPPKVSKPST